MTQADIENDAITEGESAAGSASEGGMDEVDTVRASFRISRELWDEAVADADSAQAFVLWLNSLLDV